MSIKVNLSQNRAPMSGGFRSTSLKPNAQSIAVNNRNLGRQGALSQGFGENVTTGSRREKLQLRSMMSKAESADYQNNPIVQRRLQQKIAEKAGELYKVDSAKLIKPLSALERSSNYGGNKSLSEKVNGQKVTRK